MSTKKIADHPDLNSRQVPEDSYYERRALFKSMNFDDSDLDRPFVAVANSWNEFVPGHHHLKRVGEAVKIGIWQAGGMPVELTTLPLATDSLMGLWACIGSCPAEISWRPL